MANEREILTKESKDSRTVTPGWHYIGYESSDLPIIPDAELSQVAYVPVSIPLNLEGEFYSVPDGNPEAKLRGRNGPTEFVFDSPSFIPKYIL